MEHVGEMKALQAVGQRVVVVPWRLGRRAYVWLRPWGIVLVAAGASRHEAALGVVQVMRALTA